MTDYIRIPRELLRELLEAAEALASAMEWEFGEAKGMSEQSVIFEAAQELLDAPVASNVDLGSPARRWVGLTTTPAPTMKDEETCFPLVFGSSAKRINSGGALHFSDIIENVVVPRELLKTLLEYGEDLDEQIRGEWGGTLDPSVDRAFQSARKILGRGGK